MIGDVLAEFNNWWYIYNSVCIGSDIILSLSNKRVLKFLSHGVGAQPLVM